MSWRIDSVRSTLLVRANEDNSLTPTFLKKSGEQLRPVLRCQSNSTEFFVINQNPGVTDHIHFVSELHSRVPFVIKGINPENPNALQNEYEILTRINQAFPNRFFVELTGRSPEPLTFIVLERLGMPLKDAIPQEGFPFATMAKIMKMAVPAVAALHSLGIAHFDLHTDNFCLNTEEWTEQSIIKLIDFEQATPPGYENFAESALQDVEDLTYIAFEVLFNYEASQDDELPSNEEIAIALRRSDITWFNAKDFTAFLEVTCQPNRYPTALELMHHPMIADGSPAA